MFEFWCIRPNTSKISQCLGVQSWVYGEEGEGAERTALGVPVEHVEEVRLPIPTVQSLFVRKSDIYLPDMEF